MAALMLRHLPPWMIEAMEVEEENIREIDRAFQAEGIKAAAGVVSDDLIDAVHCLGHTGEGR